MKLQKITKAWFDFPDDPDGSRFEIKHLLAGEISEIVAKTHKRRFEFRKDEKGELVPLPILETNDLLERRLTLAAAVNDWEKVFDKDGELLSCTDKNKLRTCKELEETDFNKFVSFVADCRTNLADLAKEQAKEEKKT